MDLKVERWSLDRLVPYARNARTHSDEQVAQIAASIAAFGWTVPVLADDDGSVIAGHGRVLAARKLGLAEVPVIRLAHLTPEQVRAYRIADNRLTELGGWDEALLREELAALREADFDLDLTGFDLEEIERMLAGPEAAAADGAEDDAPEIAEEPVTRPGDLWVLGEHRLLCGDSTKPADVESLLAGVVPHLMVTDPPYGVAYDPAWRNDAGLSTTARTGKVSNDDRVDWREAWALFPGDVAYVWHAGIHARTVAESLEACGFSIRAQIVWAKPRFALGRGDYHWQHEPCWYAVRRGASGRWQGARDQSTLWSVGPAVGEDAATVHGTQKPVECMRRPMVNNSARGDHVYEPFAGSGTTLIAAETTGRRCVAIELDPRYCDVAIRRWQDWTGKAAVLDGDGRTFEEIAAGVPPAASEGVEAEGQSAIL